VLHGSGREADSTARTSRCASCTDRICDPRRFEALLLELSVRFIHLTAGQIDSAIEDGLRGACEFLGLDRSAIWHGSHDAPDRWLLTHLYQHPDRVTIHRKQDGELVPSGGWTLVQPDPPPRHRRVELREFFPWVADRALREEIVVVDALDDLPAEAAHDRASFAQFGARSALVFPLSAGGRVFGILVFSMIGRERTWTAGLVDSLNLIAQVFANAVDRRNADLALRQSEERLNLAAASAGAALWSIAYGSTAFWANETARELFGTPTGELTWERFLAAVHPEDRAGVEQAYRDSTGGEELAIEYRFVRSDGGLRWAASRGRRQLDRAGGPARLMGVTIDITARKELEERLQEQVREIGRLKQQLESEVVVLRDEVAGCRVSGEILGESDAIQYVHFRIGQVAPLDTTVLIQGETGTGKNLAAAAIHARSRRKDRPMVTVSCAALPANLVESELFGHDRGAFTGADQARRGRFETADGSTIFLDEIGDLPLELQAKLLRVVQTGELERLGSSKTVRVDVRIIAATNRNLDEAVRGGRFRADLYYRLNVFPITMPPLRDRREDIPLLVGALTGKFARKAGRAVGAVPAALLRTLQEYHWPGNVRELENIIERAVIVSTGPSLRLAQPLDGNAPVNGIAAAAPDPGARLEEVERDHIRRTLRAAGWRIQGKHGAADLLGLNASTLRARMRKLGIRRETATR
jgi:PAS domain S-box-containing protein